MQGAGDAASETSSQETDSAPPSVPSKPAVDLRRAALQSVERQVAGRGIDVYRLELEEGEYLDLAVEQRGADVAIAVRSPAGEPLLRIDSPTADQGMERAELVVEQGGIFEVGVEAFGAGGSYVLRVDQLRPARERDRARAGAVAALAEAEALRRRRSGADLERALEGYREARRLILPNYSFTPVFVFLDNFLHFITLRTHNVSVHNYD
ncbi:MAG: hypothetical protein AAF560_09305, partial [Acidobacteriota bacterium]